MFDGCRVGPNEKSATEKVFLPVDTDDAFDYETFKNEIYKLDDFKEIIK